MKNSLLQINYEENVGKAVTEAEDRFETWERGVLIVEQAKRIPLLKFPKMSIRLFVGL